jgi:hypothetical protein
MRATRLQILLSAHRAYVPELAPVSKDGRQHGPDLGRAELQEPMSRPARERASSRCNRQVADNHQIVRWFEKETAVGHQLRQAVDARKAGARCAYGAFIWAIGSAEAGAACFRCITGEAWPDRDYEIDEALGLPPG